MTVRRQTQEEHTYLGKVRDISTIPLAVFLTGVGKHPWSAWSKVLARLRVGLQFLGFGTKQYGWR